MRDTRARRPPDGSSLPRVPLRPARRPEPGRHGPDRLRRSVSRPPFQRPARRCVTDTAADNVGERRFVCVIWPTSRESGRPTRKSSQRRASPESTPPGRWRQSPGARRPGRTDGGRTGADPGVGEPRRSVPDRRRRQRVRRPARSGRRRFGRRAATRNPANLTEQLGKTNEQKNLLRVLPSESQVAGGSRRPRGSIAPCTTSWSSGGAGSMTAPPYSSTNEIRRVTR